MALIGLWWFYEFEIENIFFRACLSSGGLIFPEVLENYIIFKGQRTIEQELFWIQCLEITQVNRGLNIRILLGKIRGRIVPFFDLTHSDYPGKRLASLSLGRNFYRVFFDSAASLSLLANLFRSCKSVFSLGSWVFSLRLYSNIAGFFRQDKNWLLLDEQRIVGYKHFLSVGEQFLGVGNLQTFTCGFCLVSKREILQLKFITSKILK